MRTEPGRAPSDAGRVLHPPSMDSLGPNKHVASQPSSSEEFGKFVDWDRAFETVGGDKRLLVELVSVFLDEHDKMVTDINRAITASDAKELRLTAHSIKGALTHLGAGQAADIARQLEILGQEKRLEQAPKKLEVLKKSLKELTGEFHRFKTGS